VFKFRSGWAGSPESHAAYERLIGGWYAGGRKMPSEAVSLAAPASTFGPFLSVVLERFYDHATTYCTKPKIGPDGLAMVAQRQRGAAEGKGEAATRVIRKECIASPPDSTLHRNRLAKE